MCSSLPVPFPLPPFPSPFTTSLLLFWLQFSNTHQIKMQSSSLPVAYTENGLSCADGTTLPADLIVFATGFVGNLRLVVSNMFGPEVAGQLEDYWGMDDEGEIKGAFKQSGRKLSPSSTFIFLPPLVFCFLEVFCLCLGCILVLSPLPSYQPSFPSSCLPLFFHTFSFTFSDFHGASY